MLGEGKLFAPGNLRATFDNPAYERLMSYYLGEKYTLRYTGGMVPDVFQIIVKEKGVFTNVTSPSTKAKLRILFEVRGSGGRAWGRVAMALGAVGEVGGG
jgi:sedoheptulose-bisphosphatase